jgi:GTP 3',8-cyclase
VSRLVQLGASLNGYARRAVPESGPMEDGFGRRVEYLRISVTDKCNLRCVYCMPEEGLPWLRRAELLTYEEIALVVRLMAAMGLRRIRITGGEPLVRRDLAVLVRQLRAVPGIAEIALSTNAVLLAQHARGLRAAGVDRLNVSLDSLRPERIDAISRRAGAAEAVFRGLDAAERAGFAPIKINCVVMRGRNDDELEEFARLTRQRPWHVRFIEVMPTGDNLGISAAEYVSSDEILQRLGTLGELRPVQGPAGNGPATYFAYPDAPGTVGVITPMSHNYCDRCNRMRLTADGMLRPCLFGPMQVNLRDPLRAGQPLEPLIRETLRIKPERHWLEQGSARGSGGLRALSEVGG